MKIISRSGYDVAALWLNMVKILIGLVWVYQATLIGQLKMDLFDEESFYAFSAQVREDKRLSEDEENKDEENKSEASQYYQELSRTDSNFELAVLPLSITRTYDKLRIEIVGVFRKSENPDNPNLISTRDDWGTERFNWPSENDHALKVLRFNLATLVEEDALQSGDYHIYYRVVFMLSGEEEVVPKTLRGPLPTSEPKGLDDFLVRVRFREEDVEDFGDIPIVQCQSANFPAGLRGKSLTGESFTTADGTARALADIEIRNRDMLFRNPRGRRLNYDGKTYRRNRYYLNGTYSAVAFERILDNGNVVAGSVNFAGESRPILVDISGIRHAEKERFKNVDSSTGDDLFFTFDAQIEPDFWKGNPIRLKARSVRFHQRAEIRFSVSLIVQRNIPPRPIYPADPVVIYEWRDRYETEEEEESFYYFFYLSRYIVDPDGRVRGNLFPKEIIIAEGSDNYSIVRDPKTADFRLKIANPALVRNGDKLKLEVSDDCWTESINIEIRAK